MRKMLPPIIYLLFLLLTPLTVFAVPTVNVSLLGSGPRDYNFAFENTTSATGYDIYWIEFVIPSDPMVSNFVAPNSSWESDLSFSPFITWDSTADHDDHSNMILSGCLPLSCVGNVSFDTDKEVSTFLYTMFFTDPNNPNDPLSILGSITTSVPEPSSLFLLGLGSGLIALLVYIRGFNRKKVAY